ncbi:hypothetical protein C8F01DRAFT_1224533 [Mycena amicta]|nr:hypothetical protein C8F01DRAFT_1224533 [Mycena amicta]
MSAQQQQTINTLENISNTGRAPNRAPNGTRPVPKPIGTRRSALANSNNAAVTAQVGNASTVATNTSIAIANASAITANVSAVAASAVVANGSTVVPNTSTVAANASTVVPNASTVVPNAPVIPNASIVSTNTSTNTPNVSTFVREPSYIFPDPVFKKTKPKAAAASTKAKTGKKQVNERGETMEEEVTRLRAEVATAHAMAQSALTGSASGVGSNPSSAPIRPGRPVMPLPASRAPVTVPVNARHGPAVPPVRRQQVAAQDRAGAGPVGEHTSAQRSGLSGCPEAHPANAGTEANAEAIRYKKGEATQITLRLAGSEKRNEYWQLVLRTIHELVHQADLPVGTPWQEQDTQKINLICEAAREKIPRLARCPGDWATKALAKQYLKNCRQKAYKKGQLQVPDKYSYLADNASKRSLSGSRVRKAKRYQREVEARRTSSDGLDVNPRPAKRRRVEHQPAFVEGSSRDRESWPPVSNEDDAYPTIDYDYVPDEFEDDVDGEDFEQEDDFSD